MWPGCLIKGALFFGGLRSLRKESIDKIGVLLSLGIGQIIGHFAKGIIEMSYSTTSIVAAFVCSSMIGIVFGFLPARNAAQLDPVAALARE
jgi:macrolide transport system ATP-binding/permease protein